MCTNGVTSFKETTKIKMKTIKKHKDLQTRAERLRRTISKNNRWSRKWVTTAACLIALIYKRRNQWAWAWNMPLTKSHPQLKIIMISQWMSWQFRIIRDQHRWDKMEIWLIKRTSTWWIPTKLQDTKRIIIKEGPGLQIFSMRTLLKLPQ